MKFQVPQFVEVEDKIFGKLTLKQFIYLAGGGGICIILYLFLPFFLAVLFMAPVVAFALALAFYQYNNRPFIFLVESIFMYFINTRLYIWRKAEPTIPAQGTSQSENTENSAAFMPKLSNSKLKDLTWSLDTKETINPATESEKAR